MKNCKDWGDALADVCQELMLDPEDWIDIDTYITHFTPIFEQIPDNNMSVEFVTIDENRFIISIVVLDEECRLLHFMLKIHHADPVKGRVLH